MQAAEGDLERGANMSTLKTPAAGRQEGERRKEAAHTRLKAHRDVYIRRARRALLFRLLEAGTATADDVAERIGPAPSGIDPRFLGTVPGLLARAHIIRRAGFVPSSRASRHASIQSIWELDDRAGAIAWLARNPELPDPDEDEGAANPATPKPPSPAPLAV
jgi:hypothetical protein